MSFHILVNTELYYAGEVGDLINRTKDIEKAKLFETREQAKKEILLLKSKGHRHTFSVSKSVKN